MQPPHHAPGSDVLPGPGELYADGVEMVILPRGYLNGDYLADDERKRKQGRVRRGNRRQRLAPIAMKLVRRAPWTAPREELSPGRCS